MQKKFLGILIIFLLGFLLRLYWVSNYSPDLNSQEALIGYRAKLILETGKDETGRRFPLIFTSFEDYQLPLKTYMLIPSIKLFGLSKFAVRMPLVILNSLAIFAIWGICQKIWKKEKNLKLWAAFFLATSPSMIFSSGTIFSAGLTLSFLLLGFYFFLGKRSRSKFVIGIVMLSLAVYSAKISWIFTISLSLLFFSFIIVGHRIELKREFLLIFLSLIIISLPLLIDFWCLPSAFQSLRDNDFSLFKDIGIINSINSLRGEEITSGLPLVGKIFYNKAFWLIKFLESFLKQFNPRFLFAAGDGDPLHGFSNFGPLLLILLPITLVGLLYLIREKQISLYTLAMTIWLVAAGFPSALAGKNPDQSKCIFIVPLILIIAALGIYSLKLKIYKVIFFALFFLNFIFFVFDVLYKEPIRASKVWTKGFNKFASEVEVIAQKSQKIYFTDGIIQDPAPLLLFYWQYPSEQFFNSDSTTNFEYKHWIQKIGNIQIGRPQEFTMVPGEKAVLVMTKVEEQKFAEKFSFLKFGRGQSCYKKEKDLEYKDQNGTVVLSVATVSPENCKQLPK